MTSTVRRTARSLPLRDLVTPPVAPITSVSANLMPPEVVARRRLAWLQRRLAFALVALIALVGLGYGLSRQQTSAAEDDLATEQARTGTLTQQVRHYDDIVMLRTAGHDLKTQLATAMATDVPWTRLLAELDHVAPSGLALTSVAGHLDDGTSGGTTTAPPMAGTPVDPASAPIGALEVSGTAKDLKSIASYLDALGRLKGVVQVDPGGTTSAAGHSTFTLTVHFSKAVLGGRFTTGGK